MNDDMRTKSGEASTTDPLVAFLYLLMRDHVTSGVVEEIMEDVKQDGERYMLTNGWLAKHAEFVAERLKELPK